MNTRGFSVGATKTAKALEAISYHGMTMVQGNHVRMDGTVLHYRVRLAG